MPVTYAEETGYEVDYYSSSRKATSLGAKSKGVLKIKKTILNKMYKKKSHVDELAATFMLGGRGNLVEEVIPFPQDDGCRDTSYVSAQRVANAVNTFVAAGKHPLGFGVLREKAGKNYDATDSLVNNLKTWQVLFPKCYVILLSAHSSTCHAWRLEKKIKRILLKIIEKGGGKNGKNHCKGRPSGKRFADHQSATKLNSVSCPGKTRYPAKR